MLKPSSLRPLGSSSWFEMTVRMRRFSSPGSMKPHGKAYSSGKRQNLNVQRIGGVTMAENPVSTRPPLARKPHRYKVDEGLDVRFLCHANSTHVLQTLWQGLSRTAYGPDTGVILVGSPYGSWP